MNVQDDLTAAGAAPGARPRPVKRAGGRGRAARTVVAALAALALATAACIPPASGPEGGPKGQLEREGSPAATAPAGPASGTGEHVVPLDVVDLGAGSTLLFVPVTIGGQGPFRFVLDTGASKSAVARQLAERLELPPAAGVTGTVTGVTGTGAGEILQVGEWQMGGVGLPPTFVVAVDLSWPDRSKAPEGLLGSDVLSQFGVVTIDYARSQLTLRAR